MNPKTAKSQSTEGFWVLLFLSCAGAGLLLRSGGDGPLGIRLFFMALFALLFFWSLLSLLNLRGFALESHYPVHLRRYDQGYWHMGMIPRHPLGGLFLFAQDTTTGGLTHLPPHEEVAFPLTMPRRGRFASAPVHLFAPFPFGGGSAGIRLVNTEINVLPRQVPAHYLNLPRLTSEFDRARLLKGSRDGAFKGIGLYTRYNSIKEVNWKATARTGQLMVNEFEGVMPSRKVLIAPDPQLRGQDFEWVMDFTYSLLEVLHQDWQVFLWCFDGTLFPVKTLVSVEDYFLDIYPMGLPPDPQLEFPGLKILVSAQAGRMGEYRRGRWRVCRAFDIGMETVQSEEMGVGV